MRGTRIIEAAVLGLALLLARSGDAARSGDLVYDIALAPGQGTTAAPGDGVIFVVTLHDAGPLVIDDVMFWTDLDACFERLGTPSASCDPAVVACIGTGCGGCIYTAGGFNDSTLKLAPDDGAAGGADELEIRFRVTAGTLLGACAVHATPCPPGTSPPAVTASVVIAAPPAGCNLQYADVTIDPVSPARAGDWVYLHACPPVATLPAASVAWPAVTGDDLLGDEAGGSPGSLRLYDLGCGCAGRVTLVKDASVSPPRVRLRLL